MTRYDRGGRLDQLVEQTIRTVRQRLVRPVVVRLPFWVTPNALTGLRAFCVAVVGISLLGGHLGSAAVFYGLALVTDALDGELARVRDRVGLFGARLDPFVDKALQGIIFLTFWSAAPALLSLVLLLDALLLVGGLRLLAVAPRARVDLSASARGRAKMFFQSCAAGVFLWNALFPAVALSPWVADTLLVGAVLFAVWSGVQYVPRLRTAKAAAHPTVGHPS